MYINLKVKFLPKQWERNFSEREADAVNRFTDALGIRPAKDLLKKDNVSFNFRLDDEKSDDGKREAILEFAEKNRGKVDICMYADTVYEPGDFEKAAAFILKFPKSFNYYDDWNEEKYASLVMTCSSNPRDRTEKGQGIGKEFFAPVNMTEDFFFSTNQISVVSKEFFGLVKEKVPEVMKKSIPVFKK
ncbi:MAG: hypothetical protein IKW01_01820 [Firmicutes bacterium]|nr:hypothetical protein [Bacillota bacterium]